MVGERWERRRERRAEGTKVTVFKSGESGEETRCATEGGNEAMKDARRGSARTPGPRKYKIVRREAVGREVKREEGRESDRAERKAGEGRLRTKKACSK